MAKEGPSQSNDWSLCRTPALLIGGAYSGKSSLASNFLKPDEKTCVVGTADPKEPDFLPIITELKAKRPKHWRHFEDNENLSEMLGNIALTHKQVLFDSINQWVAARLLKSSGIYSPAQIEDHLLYETSQIIKAIRSHPNTRFILVTNEVSSGMVPPKPLPQLFRQLLTKINCKIAEICLTVTTMTAGIPFVIKGEPLGQPVQPNPHKHSLL